MSLRITRKRPVRPEGPNVKKLRLMFFVLVEPLDMLSKRFIHSSVRSFIHSLQKIALRRRPSELAFFLHSKSH
eukprot:5597565-Amphidinium_carterae.1